jgi:hypothetical protein
VATNPTPAGGANYGTGPWWFAYALETAFRRVMMRCFVAAFLLLGAVTALPAQWLKIKTPGIPRTADGKPDLAAPAPRTPDGKPDLSGLWGTEDNTYVVDVAAGLKAGEIRPWAEEVYKRRLATLDRDTPGTHCLPGGPIEILGAQYRIMSPLL